MAIYKVELYSHANFEIEAKDEEEAHEKAVEKAKSDGSMFEAIESSIETSDCQYTDSEELRDREKDHERRESHGCH